MKLRIEQDQDPMNPRTEQDNLCVMDCWHRRYALGDKDAGDKHWNSHHDCTEWLEAMAKEGELWYLPLYLYDHSGITMNTTGFSCPWDSGQVGWIHITRKTLEENWPSLPKDRWEAKAMEIMVAEVAEYDLYLRGEVFGFIIEDDEGNHIDSCWGFAGYDYCKEAGEEALKCAVESEVDCGKYNI